MRRVFYRSGAIGDVIHCLPTLELMKKREPESTIDFIVGTKALKDLLDFACPYIDQVHIDKWESLDLSSKPVDEFIYLHSTYLKAFSLNAKYIKAKRLKVYKKDTCFGARENFALTCFPELAQDLLEDPFQHLDYRPLKLANLGLNLEIANKPYICVIPGVGNLRPHRAYPKELWLKFIEETLAKTDLQILLMGGPDEKDLADFFSVRLGANPRVNNLIGKTSLVEAAKIFAMSAFTRALVYSCDTGLLHIASAVGASTSSIYGITSEWRTGPFSPLAVVLRPWTCKCFMKGGVNFNRGNEIKNCKFAKDSDYAPCMYEVLGLSAE